MRKSIQIRITGRVQNVGFRYYTKKTAYEMGLNGFVRNHSDGSVYIEVEGEEQILSRFVAWCHEGPVWAHVENVEVIDQPEQNYLDFTVR
jgi:acylphosphatase